MKFEDILRLGDKEIVPELKGRVLRVHDPRNPTEGQARAGIHPQTVVLQNGAGEELSLYIMRRENHFLPSAVGEIYVFRCVDDAGLTVNRWKPRDSNDENVCVQVDKQAHYYAVEQTKEQRQSFAASQPQLGDLVSFYCRCLNGLEENLAGSKIWDAMLAQPHSISAAATTIFIEGTKRGMDQPTHVTSNVAASTPARRSSEPQNAGNGASQQPSRTEEKPAPQGNHPPTGTAARPNEEGSDEWNLAMLVAAGGTSAERLREMLKAMDPAPDYPVVFDHLVKYLTSQGWTTTEINTVHDEVKAELQRKSTKTLSEAALYKSILISFEAFVKRRPKQKAPEPDPVDDDDAGLPILD
jgi:hypothetical protein